MWLFILSVSDISFIPILSPTLRENKEISVPVAGSDLQCSRVT